jgi:hypothetical protein
LFIVLGANRIPLNVDRDNHGLAELMLAACDVTLFSPGAQAAIQRLQVRATKEAGHLHFWRFSALSADQSRLYVPIVGGGLLQVTADGIMEDVNGDNADNVWVEHPYGDPLRYKPSYDALEDFERLLVDTQACTSPAMSWLVAMHLGFFPYVRDLCPARFILELIGPQQSGKTSGAARFTHLHGLGDVKGDFTVAALANLGDIGLLVLDNKEHENFDQPLIDYLLFLATAAERGRSYSDGRLRPRPTGRPVGVITTIEGAVKAELQARCVEVQYGVTGHRLQRGVIEREIARLRHAMGSALILVLSRFLRINRDQRDTPNPVPNFPEHFTALCDLLRAYGQATDRPACWSEGIIAEWNRVIVGTEADDDDLEHPLERALREYPGHFAHTKRAFEGRTGTLYVITASELLTLLQKLHLRDLRIPKTPNGLTRRLNSASFHGFTYLRTGTPGVPELERVPARRPLGLFKPDDLTPGDATKPRNRHRLNLVNSEDYG